jgi:hypothetical protein
VPAVVSWRRRRSSGGRWLDTRRGLGRARQGSRRAG